MKKTIQNKNIFDIVQKKEQRLQPRPSPPKKESIDAKNVIAPADTAWQAQAKQMQEELQKLKEQLETLAKAYGITLNTDFNLPAPENASEEQKIAFENHLQQKAESLEKLIVIPSLFKEQAKKAARQEKRERTQRIVGTRKRWMPL